MIRVRWLPSIEKKAREIEATCLFDQALIVGHSVMNSDSESQVLEVVSLVKVSGATS